MALASEVNVARAHTSSITPNSSAAMITDARSTARMLIWPVPSLGRRATTWERRGRPRPPATTTRKITRKAGMRLSPVMSSWLRKSVTSLPYRVAIASPTPMIKPPSSVSGNERKPPRSAAPSPATVTTMVKVVAERPVSGAARTAASPPSMPPIVQVRAASRSGDQPSVWTARSFWALALMARPTRVYLVHAQSATVSSTVMPTRYSRSSCTV